MVRRSLIILGMLVVVCGVVLPDPTVPSVGERAKWEYGVYTEFRGNYDWQDAQRRVRATNRTFFFERMGFPADIEVRTNTGRAQALLLNYIGQEGWELVDVVVAPGAREIYWFKRPQ